MSIYWTSVLIFIGVNVLISWSLWLPIWAGQLCLAQAGFAAFGAYTSAIAMKAGLPFPVALAMGCCTATIAGLLVGYPTLRLPPLGTAILTMALAEMVRIFFLNFEPGGAGRGLFAIPVETNLTMVWGSVFIFLIIFSRLSRSRIGRAMSALREDQLAAESMGINLVRYKLLAFGISGLVGGLGGVLYAHYNTNISPDIFGFGLLLQITVFAFLGGRTTYWGALVGALLMGLFTEWFRFLADWRLLSYGLILVAVMLIRPQGLVSSEATDRFEAAIVGLLPRLFGRPAPARAGGLDGPYPGAK